MGFYAFFFLFLINLILTLPSYYIGKPRKCSKCRHDPPLVISFPFFFPSSSYASYSYILLILLLKKRKRKHNFMIYICEKTNDYKWHLLLSYTERGTRRVCAAACQTCSCVFFLGVLTCRDPDEGKSVPVLRDRRGVVHWWVAPVLVCGERQTPECESHARLLQHHADTPN